MLAPLALSLTLALVALLAIAFLIVARGARGAGPAPVRATESVRRRGAWLLGVGFVPVTLGSLAYAPLTTEGSTGDAIATVEVVGHQWYWELSRTRVPVGELVLFQVESADVNHGFALYDDEMRLIAQTQAMPGYTNGLQVRFEKPGLYRVLCLEYCGLVHHNMVATLEAVAEEDV